MNILDYKTISVEDIVFDTPMKTKNNVYISKAYLKNDYGDKQEVYVQTPRLNLLSGIHKTGNRAFYEVEIDAKHNEFYSFLKSMDFIIMDFGTIAKEAMRKLKPITLRTPSKGG